MWSSAFLLVLTAVLSAGQPLEDLIREEIYETNVAMVKNHTDVRAVEPFSWGCSVLSLKVSGGRAGNFSTSQLVGKPIFKQFNKVNATSYEFDISIGIGQLEVELDLAAKALGFLHLVEGKATLRNTGNAVRGKGTINTYNGDTPCDAHLEEAAVQSLGHFQVSFEPSGVRHWIVSKVVNSLLTVARWPLTHYANAKIDGLIETDEVKTKFTEMACQPFDF